MKKFDPTQLSYFTGTGSYYRISLASRRQDHNHAFFVLGFVKVAHQLVDIVVDRQHGEAVYRLPLGRTPQSPKACHAHGFIVC